MGGLSLSFSSKTTPFHPAGKSVFDCCAKEGSGMAIWQLKEKIKGDLKLQRPIQKTIHNSLKASYVVLQKKKEERVGVRGATGTLLCTRIEGSPSVFGFIIFMLLLLLLHFCQLLFTLYLSFYFVLSSFFLPSFNFFFLIIHLLFLSSSFIFYLCSLSSGFDNGRHYQSPSHGSTPGP